MKAAALSILMLFSIAGYSQNTINSYKYVLVPMKYDFAKTFNQYGLNTTTQRLLQQKGFVAIFDNEDLPPALAANKCNALKVEVSENNAFFVTKLTMQLKDCQGNVIFKSKEGKSREKDYAVAYDAALKDAFSSLNNVPYKYDSTAAMPPPQVVAKPSAPAVSSPAPAPPAIQTTTATTPATPVVTGNAGTLYAQATTTGFQLVDTTPKKILTLLKTSVQDYFIAEAETSTGIVFKKDGGWFFEYYKDGKLVSQKLEIKF